MHADHSAFVLAGVWPQASDAIGVVDVKQLPLGAPLEDVANEAARVARDNRAVLVFDGTNNSAFAGVLAARLPQPAVNWLIAAAITGALSHAAQPTPMPIAIGGMKSAVRRWTLSKSELVETIAAELGNNSLRIARMGARHADQDRASGAPHRLAWPFRQAVNSRLKEGLHEGQPKERLDEPTRSSERPDRRRRYEMDLDVGNAGRMKRSGDVAPAHLNRRLLPLPEIA
jgi:hypothetical protein